MKRIMKLGILTVSLFIFGLTSCTKEILTPTYELRFTCTSDNPYLIEVNGTSEVVQGNSFKNYNLNKGTYSWKVTQQSGYAFYPTIQEGTVNLDQDKEIIFP